MGLAYFWVVQDAGVNATIRRGILAADGQSFTWDNDPIALGWTGRVVTAMKSHRLNRNWVYWADDTGVLSRYIGGVAAQDVASISPDYVGAGINSIWIEDRQQRRVWFTVGDWRDTGIHAMQASPWVYRSIDGVTFAGTDAQPPFVGTGDYPHVAEVIVCENPRKVFVIGNWNLPSPNHGTMVYYSDDDGATWTALADTYDPVPLQKEFVSAYLMPYGDANGTIFAHLFQLATGDHNVREWGIGTSLIDTDVTDGGYGWQFHTDPDIGYTFNQQTANGNADKTVTEWQAIASQAWAGAGQICMLGKASVSAMISETIGAAVRGDGTLRVTVDEGATWHSPGVTDVSGIAFVQGGFSSGNRSDTLRMGAGGRKALVRE